MRHGPRSAPCGNLLALDTPAPHGGSEGRYRLLQNTYNRWGVKLQQLQEKGDTLAAACASTRAEALSLVDQISKETRETLKKQATHLDHERGTIQARLSENRKRMKSYRRACNRALDELSSHLKAADGGAGAWKASKVSDDPFLATKEELSAETCERGWAEDDGNGEGDRDGHRNDGGHDSN